MLVYNWFIDNKNTCLPILNSFDFYKCFYYRPSASLQKPWNRTLCLRLSTPRIWPGLKAWIMQVRESVHTVKCRLYFVGEPGMRSKKMRGLLVANGHEFFSSEISHRHMKKNPVPFSNQQFAEFGHRRQTPIIRIGEIGKWCWWAVFGREAW